MPGSSGSQKVLLQGGVEPVSGTTPPRPDVAWVLIGWSGLVLTLAGLADQVLLWVPPGFGSMEWEFATVVSSTSSVPLVAIGLTGLMGSAAARGSGWLLRVVGGLLAVGTVLLAAELLLFLTNVPVALSATEGGPRLGVLRATLKTVALALLFGAAFGLGAFRSFKLARRKAREV